MLSGLTIGHTDDQLTRIRPLARGRQREMHLASVTAIPPRPHNSVFLWQIPLSLWDNGARLPTALFVTSRENLLSEASFFVPLEIPCGKGSAR